MTGIALAIAKTFGTESIYRGWQHNGGYFDPKLRTEDALTGRCDLQ
jgi:hypothetical protein